MVTDHPLITAGITCFNAADTIVRAVEGVLAQDWPNLEIIVVDDASTDRSLEIIQGMASKDSRVRLVRHDVNKGYPAALNSIVAHAHGDFIAFFDDDDESAPGRLRAQVQRITEYESREPTARNMTFCYTNRAVVRPGKDRPSAYVRAIGRCAREPSGSAVADFLFWNRESYGLSWGEFGSCTLMARRATFDGTGPLDETFRRCAEWDLAVRLALKGGHFIAVDQPLVTQFVTPTLDKAGTVPLKYALQLRHKHKLYQAAKGSFLSSLAMAYCRFHYARGRRWRSRMFLAAACFLSPHYVLPHEVAKRWRRVVKPGHIADTWRRVGALAVFLGGRAKAISYLALTKMNPKLVAKGHYGAQPFMFRRCDVLALQEVLHAKEYDFLKSFLQSKPSPVIADIGAHIGLFSLWAFDINPGAHVVSVEASPSTFSILTQNLDLAKPRGRNWQARHAAAWRDGESIKFAAEGDTMSHHVSDSGTTLVSGVSLATIVNMAAGKIDLMKVDIEGAEETFLCSDPQALDRVDTLVIELHGRLCDSYRVRQILRQKFNHIEEIGGRSSSKPLLYCQKSA